VFTDPVIVSNSKWCLIEWSLRTGVSNSKLYTVRIEKENVSSSQWLNWKWCGPHAAHKPRVWDHCLPGYKQCHKSFAKQDIQFEFIEKFWKYIWLVIQVFKPNLIQKFLILFHFNKWVRKRHSECQSRKLKKILINLFVSKAKQSLSKWSINETFQRVMKRPFTHHVD